MFADVNTVSKRLMQRSIDYGLCVFHSRLLISGDGGAQ